jgi:membrane protein DedA with SNARE-associated domain
MLQWMRHLVDNYGYEIVVVLVLAEGVGLPLPGETALIKARKFFTEHGPKAVFLARFIVIVRTFAGCLRASRICASVYFSPGMRSARSHG